MDPLDHYYRVLDLQPGASPDERTVSGLAQLHTSKRMLLSPASAALWYRDGKPLPEGTHIKIPELAATLERIAANGPDGFYKGPTAEAIAGGDRSAGAGFRARFSCARSKLLATR